MRLHVMSDLHTEFYALKYNRELIDRLDKTDVDTVILAGDILCLSPRHERDSYLFMDHICDAYKNVIYVPGNHDHFYCAPFELTKTFEQWDFANLTLLTPGDTFKLGEYTVKGGTMWYSDPIYQDLEYLKNGFVDYRVIKHFEPWVYEQNDKFRTEVAEKMGPKDIIVSHHLPSQKSVSETYKGYTTNAFFVCDMEDLIVKNQPKLWIHGHTHQAFDYKIGESRIYCNPRGYPAEKANLNFKDRILVELE